MEIPGIAPFAGQSMLTNPLSNDNRQMGQQIGRQQVAETSNTTLSQDRPVSALSIGQVVNESSETAEEGFNPQNPGGTIDLTA